MKNDDSASGPIEAKRSGEDSAATGGRGHGGLTADQVARLIARQGAPGRRRGPAGPEAGESVWRGTRGDHDLNPDFYDPEQSLVAAAVLVPLVEYEDGLSVILTRRTAHLTDHAGQIAFPGGRIDPGDKTPEHAALRETHEEVGLPPERIRLVGRLDTYVTRTGFEVTPVVGMVRAPYEATPEDFEVAEVFEVPLAHFLKPGTRITESRIYRGRRRYFYAYPYGDYYIWGATAGMLVNLVEVLTGRVPE